MLKRLLLVALLFAGLTGCKDNLTLPDGVLIQCASDLDCPKGFACRATDAGEKRCVDLGSPQPPRLVVGTITRSTHNVSIPVTVFATDDAPIYISATRQLAGDTQPLELSPAEVTGSSTGRELSLSWNAEADLGPSYQPSLTLTLLATQRDLPVQAATSAPFEFGNDPPSVDLSPIAGPKSGDVGIEFTLSDAARDIASAEIEFRTNATEAWRRAAISLGNLSSLTTEPTGQTHAVVWNSRAPANADPTVPQGIGASRSDSVVLRVRASDTVNGEVTVTEPGTESTPFAVDNTQNSPPTVVPIEPIGTQSGVVAISYSLLDVESDVCDVVVEYTFGDGNWRPATRGGGEAVSGLEANPTGVAHVFSWDSLADAVALSAAKPATQLRFTAKGTGFGPSATTAAFTVDNQAANTAPTAVILTPAGAVFGSAVVINYFLIDAEADSTDVGLRNGVLPAEAGAIEVLNDDGNWVAATPGAGGDPLLDLSTSPAPGDLHTFVWDSVADGIGSHPRSNVRLRLRARQEAPLRLGSWVESAPFSANNADVLNLAPQVLALAPGEALDAVRTQLYVWLADAESDATSLRIEYEDATGAWREALLEGAPIENLATSPQGELAGVTWLVDHDRVLVDANAPLNLRLTPSDAFHSGTPLTIATSRQLQATPSIRPITTSPATFTATPSVTTDAVGKIFVAWDETSVGLQLASSSDSGESFSAPTTFSSDPSADLPKLVAGDSDRLWVFYNLGYPITLNVIGSDDGGSTWIAPSSTLCSATDNYGGGVLDAIRDASGVLHVLWSGWDSTENYVSLYYLRSIDDGASCQDEVLLATSFNTISGKLATGPADTLHIAYSYDEASATLAYRSSADHGANLTSEVAVNPGGSSSPIVGLGVGSDGQLHALLADGSYWRKDPAGWSSPSSVSATTQNASLVMTPPYLLIAIPGASGIDTVRGRMDSGAFEPPRQWLERGSIQTPLWGLAIPGSESAVFFWQQDSDLWTARYSQSAWMPSTPNTASLTDYLVASTSGISGATSEQTVVFRSATSFQLARVGPSGVATGGPIYSGPSAWVAAAQSPVSGSVVVVTHVYSGGPVTTILRAANGFDAVEASHSITSDPAQGQLLACNDGSFHLFLPESGAPGRIAYWRSVDDGQTFTDTGMNLGAGVGSPGELRGGRDDQGHLHLMWKENDPAKNIYHRKSDDSGVSWSLATNVSSSAADSTSPTFAIDSRGQMRAVWLEGPVITRVLTTATSDDGGTTFSAPRVIPGQPDVGVPELAVAADQHLHVLFARGGWMWDTSSNDWGAKWSSQPVLPLLDSAPVRAWEISGELWVPRNGNFFVERDATLLAPRNQQATAIPDGPTGLLEQVLVVQGANVISDVDVQVGLKHPDRSQLRVTLSFQPVVGTPRTITLLDGDSGAIDRWLEFDDDGPLPPADVGGLTALIGESAAGTWTLSVEDLVAGDTGTLGGWALRVR